MRPAVKRASEPTTRHCGRRALLLVAPLVLLVVIGAAAYFACFAGETAKPDATISPLPPTVVRKAQSLGDLLKRSAKDLVDVDVAEMNLLCATGLPGAENLDINRCLAKLDEWAAKVQIETQRHLYRVHDPKWADHYKHSENWLRAEFLAQVLQEDCGVHYNMDRVRDIDFTKSKDLFIHGMIDDANGGTCASMPVLYVAIGRRLGYPLKLVQTKAHVFVRWDAGKEWFNIETATNGGVSSYPDEHYKEWPEKLTDAGVKANRYLISLSSGEELACFLASRGHCLLDNGHAQEAFAAYAAAHRLAPQDPAHLAWMRQADARQQLPADRLGPQGVIEPPMVYRNADPAAEAERIKAINRTHLQRMQPPAVPQPPSPYGPHPGIPQSYQPPAPGMPTQ